MCHPFLYVCRLILATIRLDRLLLEDGVDLVSESQLRLGLLFLDLGVLKKPVWQGPAHAFILNNQVLSVQLHDLLTVFSNLFNSIEYVPAKSPFNLLSSPEVNAFAVVSFGFRIVECHF